MKEAIFNQDYWADRLEQAKNKGLIHHAIFKTPKDNWERVWRKHDEILRRHVGEDTSILDIGCGWGRLLSLLPSEWVGHYLGIDLSSDFIEIAKTEYPLHSFLNHDVREPIQCGIGQPYKYDLAILISFRPMIIRNAGQETWDKIKANIFERSDRILYLEYDENDEGTVEFKHRA